jgi:hypothetical protein
MILGHRFFIIFVLPLFLLLACHARTPAVSSPTEKRAIYPSNKSCTKLKNAFLLKCNSASFLDCSQITACGTYATSWDLEDLRICIEHVKAAPSCTAATTLSCAIGCM